MKAIVIDRYGGSDELRVRDMPLPDLGPTDLMIKVFAASVNPVDWKIREGYLKESISYRFPLILGWDAAGIVSAVGPEVTCFSIGDKVFSRTDIRRNGTYAEFVAVDEKYVARMPANLSFEEAASVPLVGLTAWQALVDLSGLTEGNRVLIHAGSGGVGSFAVQLAKSRGASVTTTCSTPHLSFVRSLGPDQIIDYTRTDFREMRNVDIVFDTVGGEVYRDSFQVVRPNGVLVSILEQPDRERMEKTGVRALYLFMKSDGKELAQIAELLEKGKIKPTVGRTFPLEEVRKAHELSASRHAEGKIVLQVKEG